ncbi:MAG TPA: 30S ribosomal protein S2 [Flavobacterium sp.]
MEKKKRKKTFLPKKLPRIFNSVTIPETIKKQLIILSAFKGEYKQKTHFSQIPYLLGLKNQQTFYNIDKSIILLTNALCFLKKASVNPYTKFILAGTPLGKNHQRTFFSNYISLNHKFFPNECWEPGFISKKSPTNHYVLIVFDLTVNQTAYREGVNARIPVVGFATSSCDIRGVDYPVLLNLKNHSIWYVKLILALFYRP